MKNSKESPRVHIGSIRAHNLSNEVERTEFVPPPRTQPSFFSGERIIILLTMIASFVALAVALWSLHKNSDTATKMTKLNGSVVDMIVKGKTDLGNQDSRKTKMRTTAQAIRERLDQRRLKLTPPNVELRKVTAEQMEQARLSEAEHGNHLREFEKNTAKASESLRKNRQRMTSVMGEQSLRMEKVRKNPISTNPIFDTKVEDRPDPFRLLTGPLDKLKSMTSGRKKEPVVNDEMGIFGNTPPEDVETPSSIPMPAVVDVGGVDLEDFERDLMLLEGR
jgi:hypothetical protein